MKKARKKAKQLNKLPKVVIPVHMCGQSCDMEKIYKLSKKFNFKIIEDASHAIGGAYKKAKIGSCEYSDITVFSFHPVKIVTTGEGGMALMNCKKLASKMSLLRSHGITRDESKMKFELDGLWYYEQIGLGFNYRMTDINVALGISQFKRINKFVAQRHKIAKKYNEELKHMPLKLPHQLRDTFSSFHLYVISLNIEEMNVCHKSVFEFLDQRVLELISITYQFISTSFYKKLGFRSNYCANAESYYKSAISIPIYPDLDSKKQDYVISSIKNHFRNYQKNEYCNYSCKRR